MLCRKGITTHNPKLMNMQNVSGLVADRTPDTGAERDRAPSLQSLDKNASFFLYSSTLS